MRISESQGHRQDFELRPETAGSPGELLALALDLERAFEATRRSSQDLVYKRAHLLDPDTIRALKLLMHCRELPKRTAEIRAQCHTLRSAAGRVDRSETYRKTRIWAIDCLDATACIGDALAALYLPHQSLPELRLRVPIAAEMIQAVRAHRNTASA